MDYEKQYLDIVRRLIDAPVRPDRTAVGTRSSFVESLDVPLRDNDNDRRLIPLLTSKKVLYDKVISELIWFIRGETNVDYLHRYNNHIWDANTEQTGGELGPGYGYQWRNFNGEGVDQLSRVVNQIKEDPYSRRHLVVAWNPAQLGEVALQPCHYSYQFYVDPDIATGNPKYLSCAFEMRSADLLLGVPFNIASYATLTHLVAQACGLVADKLRVTMKNCHIYNNPTHMEAARLMLERQPRSIPTLVLSDRASSVKSVADMEALEPCDFIVESYQHHPYLKIEMIK